jgi:predicted site-specific integrase-resolvase
VPAERVGRLILVRTTPAGEGAAGGVVIYARVSSHDQRADLDRQVAPVGGVGDRAGSDGGPGRRRGRVGS